MRSSTNTALSHDTNQDNLDLEAQQEVTSDNSGWSAKFKQAAWRAASGTVNGLKYVISHPITSVASLVTAAPSALNALTGPSGKGPEQIGSVWWNEMSQWNRAFSVLSGASSLVINTIMGALFLPTAAKLLLNSVSKIINSPKDFIDNVASLALGLGGGLASAAIAYNAFLWLPYGTYSAIPFSVVAFSITFASRYIGIKNVFKRFAHLFNADATLQQDLADKLDHINSERLDELEEKIAEIIGDMHIDPTRPLNQNQYEQLIVRLATELSALSALHPDLINKTTDAEYAKHYAGMIFDISFALICIATPAYITYSQKGLEGVQIIAKLSSGEKIKNLNKTSEVLIGLVPGLASSMYYGDLGLSLRSTVADIAKQLYKTPKAIPGAIALLAANGLAANSLFSIANSVISHENMYGLTKNALGTAYKGLQTTAGLVVNMNASLTKVLLTPEAQRPCGDITVNSLAKRLHDTNKYVIKPDTARYIRHSSLWRKNDQSPDPSDGTSVHLLSDDDNDSDLSYR